MANEKSEPKKEPIKKAVNPDNYPDQTEYLEAKRKAKE